MASTILLTIVITVIIEIAVVYGYMESFDVSTKLLTQQGQSQNAVNYQRRVQMKNKCRGQESVFIGGEPATYLTGAPFNPEAQQMHNGGAHLDVRQAPLSPGFMYLTKNDRYPS